MKDEKEQRNSENKEERACVLSEKGQCIIFLSNN